MNAYLAPLAIVALTLGTGSALAATVPGYLEPGYLNYHYPRQSQAASTLQSQPSGSYVEPGYLNYAYEPGTGAAPSIRIYGQSAAAGSAYSNASGHVEPGYLNYGFAPAG